MVEAIFVQPLGSVARTADAVMLPIMYLISGTFTERPQQTHFWNNQRLTVHDAGKLDDDYMISCAQVTGASRRFLFKFVPLFHMPVFGGWKEYVVIEPSVAREAQWHAGWVAGDAFGVSRIPVTRYVRLLVGPETVQFFGLNTSGVQIPIREVARGRIGDGGPYAHTPLL